MEKNIELEISSLLPGVENDHDGCIKRLETALQDNQKMQRAHLERGNGQVKLCLHYDPETISVGEVKRLAERAGVAITNRYHHDVVAIEDMDCSDCATVLEHSLERMQGVLDASASYAAGNVWVEYDTYAIDRRAIEKRIASLGYLGRPVLLLCDSQCRAPAKHAGA